MRKIALSLAVLTLLSLSVARAFVESARAGECESGFRCDNVCPLAQQANKHRATGIEAVASASAVRAARVAEVLRMLKQV